MGSLKLTTASSGSVILSPANTASDVTITVPAVTGTMAIQGPAFSAQANVGTSLSNTTWTKLSYATENFDTNSNYDTANSRFTPTVAGYYQINANMRFGIFTATAAILSLYKNGSAITLSGNGISSDYTFPNTSIVVYMNGSTDYVEAYGYQNSGSTQTSDFGAEYKFSGCLVRAA